MIVTSGRKDTQTGIHPVALPSPPSAVLSATGTAVPADSRPPSANDSADDGRALIEVVFLAVLLLVPTVYILAAVMRIQAATFAVSQGARDAGRVMDSAPNPATGLARAQEIALLALTDQRVPAEGMRLRFVATGSDCVSAPEIRPSLRPGDVYDVCVVALVTFPGVPSVVTGSRNTVTGVFTVHVGDFREGQ